MKSNLFTIMMLFFVSIGYCQLFVASGQDVFISDGSFVSTQEVSVINNGEFIGDAGDGIDLGDGEVILNASVLQTMSGPGNYENLRIENTFGVLVNHTDSTDPIDINGLLTVNGIFDAGTGNFFRLPCVFPGPNGRNAQIAESSGTISGDLTVQQCIPGRRAFRLVASSTSGSTIHNEWQENPESANGGYQDDPRPGFGTHITGVVPDPNSNALGQLGLDQTNGLDWTPSGNASMYSFNDNQTWEEVLDTENTSLNAGDAYQLLIRGSRAVDLTSNSSPTYDTRLESTGTVLAGVSGGVSITPGISNGQFALIGNPYHAVVDLSQVVPATGYNGFIYVYDPNVGGVSNVNNPGQLGGRGGFVTVDLSNGNTTLESGITGITATDASVQLQPYQAFFIQASGTPTALVFEESDKNVESTQDDVFRPSPQSKIFVSLFDQESLNDQNTPDDGFVIYFSDTANNAVDANDALKFFNQDEVIARNEEGTLVSFENRAMPVEEDVLKLYTTQYRTTNYVLEIGIQNLEDQTAYLFDTYTNTESRLDNDQSNLYAFSVDSSIDESIATDRFEIRFQSTTLDTDEFELEGISVYPNPATDIVNINLEQNIGRFDSLELFDIRGRLVAKQSLESQLQQTQLDVSTFNSGIYLLKVSSKREQITTKIIIN